LEDDEATKVLVEAGATTTGGMSATAMFRVVAALEVGRGAKAVLDRTIRLATAIKRAVDRLGTIVIVESAFQNSAVKMRGSVAVLGLPLYGDFVRDRSLYQEVEPIRKYVLLMPVLERNLSRHGGGCREDLALL